jgi:acetylornithine deacetylase/succinyl-diaminopimelate desuccinylase-like protein
MASDLHAYIDAHLDNVLSDYQAILRVPSISALSAYDKETQRGAKVVARMLRENQLEHVKVIPTDGAPLVYADWLHAPGKPTVLLYAHYDVQPVDPENEWETPPFEPTIKGDYIFGRGVTDDKSQLTTTIHAVGAHLDARGTLPVNVRFLIEGEEESSGEAIEHYVRAHPKQLASDIVVIADGGMPTPTQPALHYSCRGLLYTEIVARGARRDLHSGGYGGNAANPLFALAQIITGLKDATGHITIPGLYELVQPPTAAELASWREQEAAFLMDVQEATGNPPIGEPGATPLERAWALPTLEVHGFVGGFQGEGSKTVIPAEAKVKVSLRLVPNQTPQNVLPLLQKRVAELTPPGITTEVQVIGEGMPFFTDPTSRAFTAVAAALEEEFGVKPWLARGGGSVPISATLQEVLKADVLVVGFGLPGDRAHAANERTHLPTVYRGVHAFARMLDAFGSYNGKRPPSEDEAISSARSPKAKARRG